MNKKFFDKFKKKKLNKASSKYSKTYLTAGETLSINGSKNLKINEISQEIKQLYKESKDSPEKIIKYIESKGTKIVKAKHMEKVLGLIGEDEGFITPLTGFKALFLSIMIKILSDAEISIGFKTPEMFVFQDKPYSRYLLIHQLYHWISYLNELPGYDDSSLDYFKNLFNKDFKLSNIDTMSISDILALKETISRDLEAIKLVKEIARETIGSKMCIEKMKKGESFNL